MREIKRFAKMAALAGAIAAPSLVSAVELEGYWPLDDNGDNTINQTLTGTFPLTGVGEYFPGSIRGSALYYDTMEVDNQTINSGQAFSFSSWVLSENFQWAESVISLRASGQEVIKFGYDDFDRVYFIINMPGQGQLAVVSEQAFRTMDDWQFIAVTHDGSGSAAGVQLYVQGEAVPMLVLSDGLAGAWTANGELVVGGDGVNGEFFFGATDEAAFGLANWSAEDVGCLMQFSLACGNDDDDDEPPADVILAPGFRGFIGPTGPQGWQGIRGPRGNKGETGPRGAQGAQGDKGLPGIPGEPGVQGEQGLAGADGAKGRRGRQGAKGQKGDPGAQGPVGDVGPKGVTGAKGDQGAQGRQGQQGPKGPRGDKGDRGRRGDTGPDGPQGVKGATGAKGVQGIPGEQGDKGRKGDTGDKGDKGPTGSVGPDGPRGDKGPRGYRGPQGDAGPRGPRGDDQIIYRCGNQQPRMAGAQNDSFVGSFKNAERDSLQRDIQNIERALMQLQQAAMLK